MLRRVSLLIGLLAITSPALADGYFIVQDSTTKKCTVTTEKPTVDTMVVVSPDGTVYQTEDEATAAVKTTTVCTEE
jgi:hypothetical protein